LAAGRDAEAEEGCKISGGGYQNMQEEHTHLGNWQVLEHFHETQNLSRQRLSLMKFSPGNARCICDTKRNSKKHHSELTFSFRASFSRAAESNRLAVSNSWQ
jgi:hypothetical protein